MSSILAPSALELARMVCPAGTEIQAPPVQDSALIGTLRWPFIASSTTEQSLPAPLLVRPGPGEGLGYEDEREQDRDRDGALWARVSTDLSGAGTVENAIPHPYRQRALMDRLLCQVCAGPAAESADGWLFVLPGGPKSPSDRDAQWGEGLVEATPPVCLRDAKLSAERCPSLGQAVALWVKRPVRYGVYGSTYQLGPRGIERLGAGIAEYETPALGWTVATQMVRELTETRIDRDLTTRLRALHTRRRPKAPRCPHHLLPSPNPDVLNRNHG
ncbi:hypothetical protein ACTVZO_40405 [Streptomyces sp. IBSNAI002]|uniref:hypothetical protein n=1 Tax=Streptomyces sp. IBSNAI002 TaxID=3457500 RepID=UPI003FD17CC7